MFSIDDLFTAGLGLDLAGAILLGRGLLLSAGGIARRSATYWDFNATETVSLVRSGFEARIGFVSLALGFVCQAAAYAAVVSGVEVTHDGWDSAFVAIISAVLAAILVFVIWWSAREGTVKRQLVEVAHYGAPEGTRKKWPSGTRLKQYGFALGEALTSEEVGPAEGQRFIKRVFGVDYAVFDDVFQDDEVPPPETFEDA